MADLVVAVDAGDQLHLVEQVVVMLHELAGVFPGGMILEDDESGLEVAWFQFGREAARVGGDGIAECLEVSLRIRQHEHRLTNLLQVADLRCLLASDVGQVTCAEVGVEPKLKCRRVRPVGSHGGL